MEKFIKAYWKTILFFTAVGLFGGFFTGIYLFTARALPRVENCRILDLGCDVYDKGNKVKDIIKAVQPSRLHRFLCAPFNKFFRSILVNVSTKYEP